MVHAGETILPTHKNGAAGGVTVNQSITVNNPTGDFDAAQQFSDFADAMVARVKDDLAKGL